MEELESLDQQAIEQQYVASYKYSGGQKLVAGCAVILLVVGMIAGGTFLFVSLINLIIK